MELLRVEHLSKIYGAGENQVKALDDVSLSVEKGEFVAIVGASGSGKSTLLHLLGGVDRPTSGKVYINGTDIFAMNDDELAIFRRRQVGIIYQFYNLIPILNVEENMAIPMELDGRKVEKAQMDVFNRNQSATSSPAFQAMESAAAKLDQQYEELLAKKKQLEAPTASADSGLPKSAKLTGGTGLASEESAKALQKLNAEITGTETSVESLNTDLGQTTQLQDEISNSNIKTTAYQILEDSLQRLDTQFEQVATAQQEIFARNQSATSSPAFLALESAAEKLGRQYDELLAKKKQLDSGTTTAQPTEKVRTELRKNSIRRK